MELNQRDRQLLTVLQDIQRRLARLETKEYSLPGEAPAAHASSHNTGGSDPISALELADGSLILYDNASTTKKFRFEASGITAGQTRVYTMPDASGTLPIVEGNNVFTGTQAFGNGTGGVTFGVNGAAGAVRDFNWQSAGSTRYIWRVSGAETGSNAGATLEWHIRSDTGTFVGYVLRVWRDTRVVAFDGPIGINNASPQEILDIGGYFRTSGQKRVTANFDKTNTTLANVTGLSATLTAGKAYYFRAVLFVDAHATGGCKFAIGGTCTATSIIYHIKAINDGTSALAITSRQTSLGGNAGQAGATALLVTIEGQIVVNAGGTLTVQFAQNAASGTSTVLAGSHFEVMSLA